MSDAPVFAREALARTILDAIKAEDEAAMVASEGKWTGIDCHVDMLAVADRVLLAARPAPAERPGALAARLRELMAQATPGPWSLAEDDRNGQAIVTGPHTEVATFWHHCVESIEHEMRANSELVVEAINALPILLTAPPTFADGWRPIETAPTSKNILLYALTDTETGNWKMATGYWSPGYGDDEGAWTWDGRRLRAYETQPTHWMPLPAPPAPSAGGHEGGRDE